MKSVVFVWGQEFETHVKKIDAEHRYLVELINSLGEKLSAEVTTFEDLDPIFKELVDYSKYHFKNEETIMSDARVDIRHIKEHKNAHQNFIQKITEQYKKISVQNAKDAAKELLDFLVQWLTFHILGMDKNLSAQMRLIESGYNAEDAYNEINGVNHEQLDTLVRSFNGVFSVLMKYNEELLFLKKSLEEQVQERTRELIETNKKLENANKLLETMAMNDQLTGLANRHRMTSEFAIKWEEFQKENKIFSLIMIDLDNFKEINDTYGHDAGDLVITTFAKVLKLSSHNDDIVCRLGGDEFLVICPNTQLDGAINLAQKIHKNIKGLFVKLGNSGWQGSASIGVSSCNKYSQKEKLLKAVDNAVYQAKTRGKNCIFVDR